MQTESLKGGRLARAGGPSGLGATAMWLRTSNIVSWSPWIKRPLAARSSISAGSGRWCEGMRSHSEVRECGGQPSWMYRRVASQRGSSRCACSQSLWLKFSRVLERWAAAAWTSGSGAVGCKHAVGGGESD